jgi:hypothetical protein
MPEWYQILIGLLNSPGLLLIEAGLIIGGTELSKVWLEYQVWRSFIKSQNKRLLIEQLKLEQECHRPKYYAVDDLPTQHEGYQGLPPQM